MKGTTKDLRTLFICLLCLLFQHGVYAQTQTDEEIYDCYCNAMQAKGRMSIAEQMVETARFFLGSPYIAGSLEQEPEQLVINLQAFDCMTFVEQVVALVKTSRDGGDFADFRHNVGCLRYRDYEARKSLDYVDRLHYTSDWIYENEQRGVLKEITMNCGGVYLPLKLSFMSTHPDSYSALRNCPDRVAQMKKIEQVINTRTHCYLPQDSVATYSYKIQDGDIVCFVTSVEGLDISHLGIAYWHENKLNFIHASSDNKQVIISQKPLENYLRSNRRMIGIRVLRLSAKE